MKGWFKLVSRKELYQVLKSSDYAGNIYIPVKLSRGCNAFSLYNGGGVPVTIIVKDITLPIPANCSSGLIKFERDWFTSFIIDTELGHNFILELYRD